MLEWRNRDRIVRRSGLTGGESVLEVGPAAGFLTEAFLDAVGARGQLICLDIQLAMLRKIRIRLRDRTPLLVCASATALPFRSSQFDRSVFVSVLGEIHDTPAALSEQSRVLRPGGCVAVTEAFPDPGYVGRASLCQVAYEVGLIPSEDFGTRMNYTQRLCRKGYASKRPEDQT